MATHVSLAGSATTIYFDMWPPGYLNGTPAVVTSGSDEKVLVNSMSNSIMLGNQSTHTVYMRIIKVRARQTYDTTTASGPLAMMNVNTNYNTTSTPFLDPTTSTTFRRYYKILSVRVKQLAPGRNITLKRKIYSKQGRVIRGDLEGLSSNWAYAGMYTTIVQFSSMPMVEVGSAEIDNRLPGIAACTLVSSHSMKIVYRLIEDNDPDTNAVTSNIANVNYGVQYNTGVTMVTTDALQATGAVNPVYVTDVPIE